MEHQGGGHALVVIVHHGVEHRRELQSGDLLHFRQMLVPQIQAVDPGGVKLRIPGIILILGDHLLPAAGVAGEGIDRDRIPSWQDPQLYQRRGNG